MGNKDQADHDSSSSVSNVEMVDISIDDQMNSVSDSQSSNDVMPVDDSKNIRNLFLPSDLADIRGKISNSLTNMCVHSFCMVFQMDTFVV